MSIEIPQEALQEILADQAFYQGALAIANHWRATHHMGGLTTFYYPDHRHPYDKPYTFLPTTAGENGGHDPTNTLDVEPLLHDFHQSGESSDGTPLLVLNHHQATYATNQYNEPHIVPGVGYQQYFAGGLWKSRPHALLGMAILHADAFEMAGDDHDARNGFLYLGLMKAGPDFDPAVIEEDAPQARDDDDLIMLAWQAGARLSQVSYSSDGELQRPERLHTLYTR